MSDTPEPVRKLVDDLLDEVIVSARAQCADDGCTCGDGLTVGFDPESPAAVLVTIRAIGGRLVPDVVTFPVCIHADACPLLQRTNARHN